MRNFTVLAVFAALSIAATAGRPSVLSPQYVLFNMESAARSMEVSDRVDLGCARIGVNPRATARMMAPKKHMGPHKVAADPEKIKASRVQAYGWNGNGWVEDVLYDYSFDASGNITVELAHDAEGDCSRTVREYNDHGKVTSEETKISSDGVNYKNHRKSEIEYDPILTNVITRKDQWAWLSGNWMPGDCYKRIIERDEKGNITGVAIAVLFNGDYDPTQRLVITYGADGKATEISESILNYDYATGEYFWEQGPKYTDIVWDRTDGQIYDIDDIFIGENRIKSGLYVDSDDLQMEISVEYADDSDAYLVTMLMEEEGISMTATTQYTPLENEGYIAEMKTETMGFTLISIKQEMRFDDWGLMTLQEETIDAYGSGSGYDTVVGIVEYDAEGKPTVYTVTEEYSDVGDEKVSTEHVIRAEYSDYVDVTASVKDLNVSGAAEEYYDLNGIRVNEPASGRIVVTKSGKKIQY
ncbi:MAG: hypothetical protein K2N35_05635 [Muribaculaceae bacterium]|nr:hypothetical protein [Muribaculaceae bacterium]